MMGDCSLEIITRTEGAVSRFTASGIVKRSDGGFIVSYSQDGDEAALAVKQESLCMHRKGRFNLSAEFQSKKRTAIMLNGGASFGEIPVFTSVYSYCRTETGFFCKLNYELLFPKRPQKFLLKISVKIFSEEK